MSFVSAAITSNLRHRDPPRDQYFSDVALLLDFEGTDGDTSFTSSDSTGHTVNFFAAAEIDNTASNFGSTSLRIPGTTTSRVEIPTHADFNVGTQDFTVELFVRTDTATPGTVGIFDMRPEGTPNGNYIAVHFTSVGQKFRYYVNGARITSTSTMAANTWYHLVICREGTSTRMFVDGTQEGSTWTDSTSYIQQRIRLGCLGNDDEFPMTGYIDDVRFTVGVARYTANFTPPSKAYPTW